jgi:hypothetical protein
LFWKYLYSIEVLDSGLNTALSSLPLCRSTGFGAGSARGVYFACGERSPLPLPF